MGVSDLGGVPVLVEQAIACVELGQFVRFRAAVEQLGAADMTAVQSAVESRADAALAGRLGDSPSYEDMVKLSQGAAVFISNFLAVEPLELEVVIRRFYGEPDLVRQAGMAADLLLPLELALAGFLRVAA